MNQRIRKKLADIRAKTGVTKPSQKRHTAKRKVRRKYPIEPLLALYGQRPAPHADDGEDAE